ncbi:hypothetical protein AXK11_03655 [Cephaloticoccus primus]|uniref:TonB-dependent receptor n=2 Tax=Cephaloticoccus primus TaxID=1548207 RepID=A0A139SQ95_9BACT|nr:hypothetical protein AXK11_03655 [Cephaloticoccus primus]
MSVQASDGYHAPRSISATRTDTAIEDIPQSVSVIPAQVLEDLDVARIDAALDFAGGVVRGNDFGGLQISSYNVRGFSTGEIYRNGFPANRGTSASPDSASIERVEVLKGPSSGLYGRSDPGGLVNIVTKRPQQDAFTNVRLSAGSWDRYRSALDINHPLNARGTVLTRLNLAVEDNGSFREYVKQQRQVIAPSLTWHINDKTQIQVDAEIVRNDSTYDRGITPVNGNIKGMSIRRFLGEPNDGMSRNNNQSLQAALIHQLGQNWKVRLGHQNWHGHLRSKAAENRQPAGPDFDVIQRRRRDRDFEWHGNMTHLDFIGSFTLAGMSHQLLLGIEHEDYSSSSDFFHSNYDPNYSLNIYNPVYGAPKPPIASHTSSLSTTEIWGFNIQDQVQITERLRAQLGLRFEDYKLEGYNRITGAINTPQKKDATTPRLGFVYEILPELNVFASASKSFKPNGVDELGNSRKPQEGVGYEIGTKFGLFDGRLGATFGLFHITKENVLTSNPDYPASSIVQQIPIGEQRSEGFDMQIAGSLTRSLRLIAAYAYIDAEVSKSNTPSLPVGRDLQGIPRHSGSLMGVYQIQTTVLKGSEIGASVNYVGERPTGTDVNRLIVSDYLTAGLFLRYRPNANISIGLNVNNLFDKQYYDKFHSTTWIVPAAPRNFSLNISLRL